MTLPRFLASILLVTSLATGYAQTPVAFSAATPDSNAVLYDSFFFRVAWFERIAQQQEAKGGDGSSPRSVIRRQAGLKPAEEQALRAVAIDYRSRLDAINAEARAAVLARAQFDSRTAASQRRQLVLDHIDQLRSAVGPRTFLRLDTYVRLTVKPQVSGASKK
jgi:hypothetical protein